VGLKRRIPARFSALLSVTLLTEIPVCKRNASTVDIGCSSANSRSKAKWGNRFFRDGHDVSLLISGRVGGRLFLIFIIYFVHTLEDDSKKWT
jgi:hypothetical protein